ncbi:MAG: hypothetical protein HQ510_01375 [Candidatus Marinimicrobia bacterium]|nr:hypothetical protein [Candidatus Neomarinimicrobiota bacterium]
MITGYLKKIPTATFILLGLILSFNACAPSLTFEKFSKDKFIEYNLTEIDIEEMQFFVEAPITLRYASLPESNKAISNRKSKAKKKNIIVIDEKTAGILSDIGEDWVDINFGDEIILRFVPSDPGDWYRLAYFNGQPIMEGEIVTYNDKEYIVVYRHISSKLDPDRYFSEIPYLYFNLGKFLDLQRNEKVVGGEKL